MQAPTGSVGRQGLPGAASPQAMIKLSRPPRGRDGLRAYRVVVDGRPVAKLRRGRTCAIAVGPGRHRLYVRLDWWLRCPRGGGQPCVRSERGLPVPAPRRCPG
jgi:hypothetical protein